MKTWHLLAPEYPPICGGVGDYAALLAEGLRAAGDFVRVWHPGTLPDRFGPRARTVLDAAMRDEPGVLLVQYVPASFGLRGMNVPFCRWIDRLGRRGLDVRVMIHEPFFYFGFDRPWRNGLAIVQRVMLALVLRNAARVYYSTGAWTRLLARYPQRGTPEVLPIPSTIPVEAPADAVAAARDRARGRLTIGHFGTYGDHVGDQLSRVLPEMLRKLPEARLVLAGRGAAAFAAVLNGAQSRTDIVESPDGASIAAALRACDILVQPYPDGVTTRRTSMMASLASGVPVVTTRGALTENVWSESGAVALADADDPRSVADAVVRLAQDSGARRDLGARGRRLYDEQFDLAMTVARIRR